MHPGAWSVTVAPCKGEWVWWVSNDILSTVFKLSRLCRSEDILYPPVSSPVMSLNQFLYSTGQVPAISATLIQLSGPVILFHRAFYPFSIDLYVGSSTTLPDQIYSKVYLARTVHLYLDIFNPEAGRNQACLLNWHPGPLSAGRKGSQLAQCLPAERGPSWHSVCQQKGVQVGTTLYEKLIP